MISSVQASISALQAYKKKMEVVADNVANVNTEEFKKSRALLREGLNGDVQVEISRVDSLGYRYQELEGHQLVEKEGSNVDLGEEIPEMIVTQHAYKANLKVVQTQDRILGTLLDIMS